jgi:hypothetical protein
METEIRKTEIRNFTNRLTIETLRAEQIFMENNHKWTTKEIRATLKFLLTHKVLINLCKMYEYRTISSVHSNAQYLNELKKEIDLQMNELKRLFEKN